MSRVGLGCPREADALVETYPCSGIRPKAKDRVPRAGASLEGVHESAPDPASAYGSRDVEVPDTTCTGLTDVRIRRDSSDCDQVVSVEYRKKELSRPIETDGTRVQIRQHSLEESEPFRDTLGCEPVELSGVSGGELANGHPMNTRFFPDTRPRCN